MSAQKPITPGPSPSLPAITAVVPTLGRRISAARTVRSILANDYPNLKVLLVDQSHAPLAPETFPSDPRFVYIQSQTRGISAARNVGVRLVDDGLIVHTDDDCEAPPTWLESIADVFADHPDVDIVYGEVTAGKTGPGGFIPSYKVTKEVIVNRLRSKHRIEGIGACLAYRRPVWDALGGFDEALGAGSEFRSAEEVDLTVRALARGHVVMETPRFFVIHHGYRAWHSQEDLLSGHLLGIGVAAAKQVRKGSPAYLYTLTRLGLRWLFGKPAVDFGKSPARLPRLRAFSRGFRHGWREPLDDLDRISGRSAEAPRHAPAKPGPPRIVTPQETFPNFFIIGAPKSGTSSLFRHLEEHPDVFMSPIKEPNFMALDVAAAAGAEARAGAERSEIHQEMQLKAVWTAAEYVDLFRGRTTERAIGEGSSWYLHSAQAPQRIRYYAPESKLIAVLRDPAERAYSAYRMHRRLGFEPCATFEQALDQQDVRLEKGRDWGLEYRKPGFYRRHLEAYREEFESGRLLIHLTEDLAQDPPGVMKKTFEFLGVDPAFNVPAAQVRHNASPGWGPLSKQTRERLIELYREDILGLQELLRRDLSAWLQVERPGYEA